MADRDFIVKNGLHVNNGVWVVNTVGIHYTGTLLANSTNFVGTANSTLFVGSNPAAVVVNSAQLSSNLGNYQTLAGLSANVAALAFVVNTSGNFTVAGNINFTNVNNYFSTGLKVGANVTVNTTTAQIGANVIVNTNGLQVGVAVVNTTALAVGASVTANTTAINVGSVSLTSTGLTMGSVVLNTSAITVSSLTYGNNAVGNKYISASGPTGGASGDVWYKV
jgi:hypothetical protein